MGKEKKEKKHKHKHSKDKKEKKRHGSSKKDKSSKKRKRDDSSSSGSESSSGSSRQHQPSSVPATAVAAPPSRMPLGLSYDDLFPIPTKRKVTGGASSSISSFSVTASEMQQRANRAERFVESAADAALREHRAKSLAHASTAGGALRGQSVQLEKSYTRLTTLPNAADVRPLPVLRQVRVSVRVRSRDSR